MSRDQDVMNSLLEKLYNVVSAGDTLNNVVADRPFIAFTTPGIPISEADVDFGFLSQNPIQIEAAADFSDLANTVPNPIGFWADSGSRVDAEYRKVLQNVVLPQSALSQAEQDQLAAAKARLVTEAEIVDLDTGALVKVPVETPLFERYQTLKANYENILLAHNSAFITAMTSTDPAAKMHWNLNGPVLAGRVKAAYQKWLAGGKNSIEQALARIELLEGRGPAAIWADLVQRFDASERRDGSNQPYRLTKYFPASFWDAAHAASWATFSFSHAEVHTVSAASSESWGGGAGVSFGLWSFGGSASRTVNQSSHKSDAQNLSLAVDLVKLPLRRSWWDPGILKSRSWKFDPAIGDLLSDGNTPPSGLMPMYPTALLVARNLKIGFDTTSVNDTSFFSQFSSSASVGWGPFSVRGNYSRTDSKTTHDFTRDAAGITCPGMQILGFICQVLPKSPDPDPALNWP